MPNLDDAPTDFKGATLLYFPFRFPKRGVLARGFEAFYDWYFAVMCTFFMKCDVVYFLGTASGFALPLCRLSRSRIVVNVDGVEWKRAKFSRAQRNLIKLFFYASLIGSHSLLLDNSRLLDSIPQSFRNKVTHIRYGVTTTECKDWNPKLLQGIGKGEQALSPTNYWLIVSRLEPDNNIHTIIEGYCSSRSKMPLVVVGSFSSAEYERSIRNLLGAMPHGKEIVFMGSLYDQQRLHMLRCYCCGYIHGHSVGGTNPSLLEAMSARNLIIAHDNVFNREVCSDFALYFVDAKDLADRMDSIENDRSGLENLRESVYARVSKEYRWEDVTVEYDRLFQSL
jgi:rhamnosyltransferase